MNRSSEFSGSAGTRPDVSEGACDFHGSSLSSPPVLPFRLRGLSCPSIFSCQRAPQKGPQPGDWNPVEDFPAISSSAPLLLKSSSPKLGACSAGQCRAGRPKMCSLKIPAITFTQHEGEALGARRRRNSAINGADMDQGAYRPVVSWCMGPMESPQRRGNLAPRALLLPQQHSLDFLELSFCRLFLGHDQSSAGAAISPSLSPSNFQLPSDLTRRDWTGQFLSRTRW